MHFNIVAVEGVHLAMPQFEIRPPNTSTQTVYERTSPEELRSRIHDAHVVITTTVKMTAEILAPHVTPNLKLVAVLASGTDHVDIEACRMRGITVCNTPGGMVDAVANHAVALYFATRRSIPMMHSLTVNADEWKSKGSVASYMRDARGQGTLTCTEEICGIIGYGKIGKRIAELAKALGMEIVIADRKSKDAVGSEISAAGSGPIVVKDLSDPKRTPFSTVLRHSTTLVVICPLTEDTRNLISTPELSIMSPNAIVINVSRGGVVDEAALATALLEKKISGAASDVFAGEPAGPNDSPLFAAAREGANFVATPHVAWFALSTMKNLQRILKDNVESWARGEPKNVVG